MHRVSTPAARQRRFFSLTLALALITTAVSPAAAWNNGNNDGDGYGTHDWASTPP